MPVAGVWLLPGPTRSRGPGPTTWGIGQMRTNRDFAEALVAGAAETPDCTALSVRSMVRMGPVVRATEDPPGSPPTSRHLTSPLTVVRELRRCRLAWRLPPTRSHGGSQGFKSPHLHPTTALVSGLVGRICRAGAVPGSPSGQQTGSKRERNGPCRSMAATMMSSSGTGLSSLPITAGCSASTWMAPDGSALRTLTCRVGPDGSRTTIWMNYRDDQGRIRHSMSPDPGDSRPDEHARDRRQAEPEQQADGSLRVDMVAFLPSMSYRHLRL